MARSTTVEDASEKRRILRIRVFSPLHAILQNDRVTLIDISSVGARIESRTAIAIGSLAPLRLTLESDSVELTATVVRSRLDRSIAGDAIVYDIGLEFTDLDDATMRALKGLIRAAARIDLDARRKYARSRPGSTAR